MGHINPFYEFMREVAPGDLIFSFADTYIRAIGIAKSHCYECPKPLEFGSVGMNWEQVGWKVDVEYRSVTDPSARSTTWRRCGRCSRTGTRPFHPTGAAASPCT